MQLAEVRDVYEAEGPFATIYMEGRSPAADAEHQVRLRWDDLRGRLQELGAEEATLEALDAAIVVEDITEVQANGRVLVASPSGVLLNAPWDAALGSGDEAHYGEQAVLGDYVRERARSVRMLVAIVDQKGAVLRQIVAAEQHELQEQAEHTVESSSSESVHKPREGALSHRQIQRRADEAVKQNVRGVADRLDAVAATWVPDVVILAGEVQGRAALKAELSEALSSAVREAERGGTADDAAEQALADQLRDIAADVAQQRSQELTERFEEAKAHDRAAEGPSSVAEAAEMGAVDTLLLEYSRQAVDEANLLGISARGDANAGVIDRSVEGAVAAVLRFEKPEGPLR